jgi:adenylyl- and sulfurtransferase ThiI
MNKYDCLLMLSGGKDSCSLAFKLKEQGLNILCFTLDTGFLSDVAKSNIEKLTRILDVDSIVIKPKPSKYLKFIEANLSLMQTCLHCSYQTLKSAIDVCKQYDIKTLYAGFTYVTAKSQGWPIVEKQSYDGVNIIYPFMVKDNYNFQAIKANLTEYGLEFDPTKTNCQHIRELIGRDSDNCFEKEIEIMFKEGQITQDERNYYSEFIKSCRVH